ncbi:MAG: histidine phosphatase family protein [Geminicoccaceae bacterium]|nr:MAG: histidine phosphatase family protein [Geminicoccaceae bacterium]
MTEVLLVRHAPTAWNEAGRLQGRADPPLSPQGRAVLAHWRLPQPFAAAPILTSPLRRAQETAAAFGAAEVEPRLIEMDWGAWEGRRLGELRDADPDGMAAIEARGLDLRPPGGECPRDVMARLDALFRDLAPLPRVVLVAHKGTLRAAMALAVGWAMTSKPPVRLGPDDALAFALDAAGRPRPPLTPIRLVGD